MTDLVKGKYSGKSVGSINQILRQIVSGVRYLHDNNVIHRDLKPGNILISIPKDEISRPVMKLADFGMSRIVSEDQTHLTRTQQMDGYSAAFGPFGTDGWIAPEVRNGERTYTNKIDIFPLGLIIFFVWTGGCHPCDNDEMREEVRKRKMEIDSEEIEGEGEVPLFPSTLNEEFRLAADRLFTRMTEEDPNNRPTAKDILEDKYFYLVGAQL